MICISRCNFIIILSLLCGRNLKLIQKFENHESYLFTIEHHVVSLRLLDYGNRLGGSPIYRLTSRLVVGGRDVFLTFLEISKYSNLKNFNFPIFSAKFWFMPYIVRQLFRQFLNSLFFPIEWRYCSLTDYLKIGIFNMFQKKVNTNWKSSILILGILMRVNKNSKSIVFRYIMQIFLKAIPILSIFLY